MIKNKILKKISAIVLTFALLLGTFCILEHKVNAYASESPVKMYFCDHRYSYHGYVAFTVYIQVDAQSAANRAVYVHHTVDNSDEWADTEATFFTKLDDNTEIWKADITSCYEHLVEYAIKYVVNDQTYWDNNNGNNYKYNNILGTANVKAGHLFNNYSNNFYLCVTVKNLAYDKSVKIRYTLDNWATYQEEDLHYLSEKSGTDSETWTIDLKLDTSNLDSFQFCISYEVNGQTYWDNNFGSNYDINY